MPSAAFHRHLKYIFMFRLEPRSLNRPPVLPVLLVLYLPHWCLSTVVYMIGEAQTINGNNPQTLYLFDNAHIPQVWSNKSLQLGGNLSHLFVRYDVFFSSITGKNVTKCNTHPYRSQTR